MLARLMEINLQKHNFGAGDASFQAAGGEAGVTDLVTRFYRVMDTAPEAAHIRAMHPKDITVTADKLALFLCGWLGGPQLFGPKYGSISIPGVHQHLVIHEEQRDAWLFCMERALEEVDYADDFKQYLLKALSVPAERVRITARD